MRNLPSATMGATVAEESLGQYQLAIVRDSRCIDIFDTSGPHQNLGPVLVPSDVDSRRKGRKKTGFQINSCL